MDNEVAKRLWRKAYLNALMTDPRPEIAEEIAQTVIVSYLVYEHKHGKISKQTIGQAVVDAFRLILGDTRNKYPRPDFVSLDVIPYSLAD